MTPEESTARRRRGISLDRTLPLLIVVLLLVVIAASFTVTEREVTSSARVAMVERLGNFTHELAASATRSTGQYAHQLRRAGSDSVIRAALAGAKVAPADLADALRHAVPSSDSVLAVRGWSASGAPLALSVGDSAAATVAPRGAIPARGDSSAYGPLYSVGGRVYFWLVSPVTYGARRIGWIAVQRTIAVRPEAVREIHGLIGRDVTLYFRNDTGTFWASLAGAPASPPTEQYREGDALVRRRAGNPDAGRLFAAESPIDGTPWTLTLERPAAAAVAGPRRSLVRLALVNLALLIAGAAAAWALSRWLTRPLVQLTEAASTVARGEYAQADDALASRITEVGRLAAAFNHMAGEVSASHAELEHQVEEAQALSEELEQTNADLRETTKRAEEARAAAEAANRAKSEFLAMMSHELRTPLNAIAGYVELLTMELRGPITPAQRQDLERIRRSERTLLSLVEDVLGYARIEAGRVEYRMEEVPLDEAVAAAATFIAPQAAARGIAYEHEPQDLKLCVWADREKLERIVLNLLANAVKFTEPGGRMTVSAEPRGDVVLLRVRDTGIGIPAEKAEAIFEPFTQAESGLTRTTEGTGLGLAISREYARAMGGDLRLEESTIARGSTFTLRLPARPPGGVAREG